VAAGSGHDRRALLLGAEAASASAWRRVRSEAGLYVTTGTLVKMPDSGW
jgi:hypothetical protein